MARGMSLHVGVNKVDPAHYDGWDGALNACEFDARDMRTIADRRGFESELLLTADARADAVSGAIKEAAGRLSGGDAFLLTYSGHGGQVPDTNRDEETDRSDETWVLYDRQLVDDELFELWGTFRPGVRILVLSDSCHSGTVTRRIEQRDGVADVVSTREQAAAQSPRYRAMPWDVTLATYRGAKALYEDIQRRLPGTEEADVAATVLLISGCQDDQLSLDGFSNGLFTENLLGVWNDGRWNGGGARELCADITARMPSTQRPNFTRVGAQDAAFERQPPFMVA
jgi:metacaspase-1